MGGRSGIPMSRRVELSAGSFDDCPARHCWVSGAADDEGVKRPGLLVEWRAAHGGWEGRVLYVARLRAGDWAVVEEWLPAALLSPR
jgi:hypothetical protein